MKIDRQIIFEKYNKNCGYCGQKFNSIKDMQVDHIDPQWMFDNKFLNGDKNSNENLMPSCRTCNHYKRGDNLKQFRHKMMTLSDRVCSHYIGKVALKYGIVNIKPFNGIFYFETFNTQNNDN